MNLKSIVGILYLLITAIIWGASFISQLFGGIALGSYWFIGYRCIFGCLTITLMIYIVNFSKYKKLVFFTKDENIKDTLLGSAWCGLVLFASMATQQIGVEQTDTAKAGLIAALEVVCVPILMNILYKNKIRLITWIFIITTMFGIMMLSINSITGINMGDVWVFISTVLYSITIIQVPKYIVKIEPLKFSLFRFVMAGILGFIFAVIFERDAFSISNIKNGMPSILFSGILASGVAYTLQILGQKYVDPVIATLLMSLEGVFAAIFGWIILGQKLNLLQILGIIIAFVSICMVQISDYYTNILKQTNEGVIKET